MALYKGSLRVCPIVPRWRGFWAVIIKGFPGTVVDCGSQKTIDESGKVTFKFLEPDTYTFVAYHGGETEVKQVELVEGTYFVEKSMYVGMEGFTLLQYIQNSGGAYIDTEIIGKGNLSTKAKVIPLSTSETSLLSCRNGGSGRVYLGCRIFSNVFSIGFKNEYSSSTTPAVGEETIVEYTTNNDLGVIKVNNEVVFSTTISSSFNTGRNLYMFANNYDAGLRTSAGIKCCYLNIYDGDNQIAEFLPVKRDIDDEVGMYNVLNQKFYPNDGEDEFVPGPEV